ncbi:MAG TPA: HAMP domain-containing sensor histidine kinase [Bryobacteraceae bacterium]|nr:HAMP domain-containing sensor histidine kinase [Bryobacteraceae bacterium]
MSSRKKIGLGRAFGNLKVRPKLMVLHNLFFLVLTCGVYFSLIPLFEKLVADAHAREVAIVRQVPSAAGEIRLSQQSYEDTVFRARVTLFLVLGGIYALAVLSLEAAIIPLYVYRPLRRMLAADSATQAGDRAREIIPAEEILGDEIGQIMRSRNAAVSALRRREDELAAALRRLEEQDRLVSLGLLSASVAHELNTPLAVLNGSIEKLIETTAAKPKSEIDRHTLERLERMQRVALRLKRISESLVDFSRVRKTQMEATAIRPLVEEAWSLVAIDEKSSHVEFSNNVRAEHRVVGNSDRLLQVFVNLLRNAMNAVDSSGRIEVRSRSDLRDGRPSIMVTVEDNGSGIAADVLPDLFDAFVTTRLDARGTGLGLTVSEGIVTQHGGTISASNRPEGGACLEISLPAA